MTATALPPAVRRARVAVAVVFFVNGAAFANWVPRIPEIADRLDLSPGVLGLALVGMGCGGLPGSFAGGPLVARFSSRTTTVVAALCLCAVLPLLGLASSAPLLFGALLLLGIGDGVMDVAMNAHGVVVQERYGRSILNSFHALWSLGAAVGAGTGSIAAGAGLSPARHLALVSLVLAVTAITAGRLLLPTQSDRVERGARVLVRPTPAVLLLGLLALLAAFVEGVPADWSALYVRRELDGSPGQAGLPFMAFSVAMVAGRLAGDAILTKFGPVLTTRAGALLVSIGFGTSLLFSSLPVAIGGFVLAGLGISTLFPVAFAAAAAVPGMPPGGGIAIVSFVSRIGFLIEAPIVGGVAELGGLAVALAVAPIAALLVALLAGATAVRR